MKEIMNQYGAMLLSVCIMAAVFSFLLQSKGDNGVAIRIGDFFTAEAKDVLTDSQATGSFDTFWKKEMPTLFFSGKELETDTTISIEQLLCDDAGVPFDVLAKQSDYQLLVLSCNGEDGLTATITTKERRSNLYFDHPGSYCISYLLTDGDGHRQQGYFWVPVQRKL